MHLPDEYCPGLSLRPEPGRSPPEFWNLFPGLRLSSSPRESLMDVTWRKKSEGNLMICA